MTRVRSALVGLLIAAPFYWLLVDTASSPELIAGAVAAVIAATAYSAAHFEAEASATIRFRWLPGVLRELAKVPRGVLIVSLEILAQTVAPRARRGAMEDERFDTGTGAGLDLGRRALVEATRSLAPDTIVLGTDPEHDRLISHRMGGRR